MRTALACCAALCSALVLSCVPESEFHVPDFSAAPGSADMGGGGDGGKGWRGEKSGTSDLRGVWVADAALSVAYLVGQDGVILRRSGDKYTREDSGTAENLYAVAGTSADEVFAVGRHGVVLHRTFGKWTREAAELMLQRDLFGLAMIGPGEVYAVGDAGTVLHRSGGAWKAEAAPADADLRAVAVSGSGGSEVWAVGVRVIARRDSGGTWTLEKADNLAASLQPLYGIAGAGGTLYAAGEYGQVIRRAEDAKWKTEAVDTAGQVFHFYGMYGAGSEVWAVGSGGGIYHGTIMAMPDMKTMRWVNWAVELSGTTADLFAVAGAGTGAVVAVGQGGTVVRRQ